MIQKMTRELFSPDDLSTEEEVQVQELSFIVEGCVFRGDLEIPTPPPSDTEWEDSLTDYDGRVWKDVRIPSPEDDSRAAWERDDDTDSRSHLPVGWNQPPAGTLHSFCRVHEIRCLRAQ
jgi:hypothetical protein